MIDQLPIEDYQLVSDLLGTLGSHASRVEKAFSVQLRSAPDGLQVEGQEAQVHAAKEVLQRLLQLRQQGIEVTDQLVTYLTEQRSLGNPRILEAFNPDAIVMNAKGKPILAKTLGQSQYIEAIRSAEITFATGPAGTGKTYLAVAMAVRAFREHRVDRIILTRPAVEAGEKLGFLPGDLQMKVDPYMRPLYDALHDLLGPEVYLRNMEKGLIEVSPLAYMRGRTLDNAFIILDEAQNTTPEQMKMFLTRIGFHSRVVVTGDITQIDLPREIESGLRHARRVLKGVGGIKFIDLASEDVVRNGIVREIIRAYDKVEQQRKPRKRMISKGREGQR